MTDYIDGYCERLAPGFWGEPLNAVTNLSFLIAAWLIWRAALRAGTADRPALLIPLALLALTGIGSFLFHTFANGWSAIADTAALSLCLIATLYAGARVWLGHSWLTALIWPAMMVGAAVLLGAGLPFIPGAFYLGPLAAGAVMTWALYRRDHPAWRWVGGAVLVFVPSFIARSLDISLCESFPSGTHFVWHVLNGVVLGLAIRPLGWQRTG